MEIFTFGVDQTTQAFLEARSFQVICGDGEIESAEDLFFWVELQNYQAIIIDLTKTAWGGLAVRYLRSKHIDIPCVGIDQSNGAEPWSEQRATFLENGGDDLLHAPPSPRELAATLRAITRRSKGMVVDIREYSYGDAKLRVNLSTCLVTINGEPIHLTGKERQMMMLIAASKGRVLSKEHILSGLYSDLEDEAEIKIIDVFICKLRGKLKKAHPDAKDIIETVWGQGYRIREDATVETV